MNGAVNNISTDHGDGRSKGQHDDSETDDSSHSKRDRHDYSHRRGHEESDTERNGKTLAIEEYPDSRRDSERHRS